MKKILLLLVSLLATTAVWAEDYITDVMLIGGTQSETNTLKASYTAQGWTVIDQNLNQGAGGDYIYLLYKAASDTTRDVSFITDFTVAYYSNAQNSFVYNGRNYNLVPCDGGTDFIAMKGNLNSNAGGNAINLFYTREDDDVHHTVRAITFNSNPNGAVCGRGTTSPMDLNMGCNTSTAIYMHLEKSQGWAIAKNSTGNECNIIGFDGPAASIKYLKIPVSIDGATVKGFASYFNFNWFKSLEEIEFGEECQLSQMPVMEGCSKLRSVNTDNTVGKTPPSMTCIPSYAFSGTRLGSLYLTAVTDIGDYAFSNINNNRCLITYSGSISDWNPTKYIFSLIAVSAPDGSCGWCGGDNPDSHNFLYWTLDTIGNLNVDCYDYYDFDCWEAYPEAQEIHPFVINKDEVKHVTLQHVHDIVFETFYGWNHEWEGEKKEFINIETFEAKSGLVTIGTEAFVFSPKLSKVSLPSTLTTISVHAFAYSPNLKDLYFEGTKAQWNNVSKGEGWNDGVSQNFQAHWRCTVTFDNKGIGTAPEPQILWSNEDKVTEPDAPSAPDSEFTGWYTDAECTTLWDFNNEVSDNMTLYAGWNAQHEPIEVTAGGVTFNMIKVNGNDDISTFYIGECEVTEALWHAVMGENPSSYQGNLADNLPVEMVSWNDCQEFLAKLRQITNLDFRLPTSAEWLFAASGGNYTHGYTYSGSNTIDEVAWYASNCEQKQTVGTKAPNELGIYDMSGNVYEIIQEATKAYGGGWHAPAKNCKVNFGWPIDEDYTDNDTGLRLAITNFNEIPEAVTVGDITFNMIKVDGNDEISTFYIGECEVTEALWQEVMGSNPSSFQGNLEDNLPVEMVTWNDCQAFLAQLKERTNLDFRLPTSAEWVFAASGGNKTNGYTYSGSNTIGDVAWYKDNCSQKMTVGTKAPNELGIYDMSGNVYEIIQEATGVYGGGWHAQASSCKVYYYWPANETFADNDTGFRLALTNLDNTSVPGDANGDGNVDVNDVTTVINYILGKNPDPFIFDNANVNGDSNVDVNDVTMIINMILGIIQ